MIKKETAYDVPGLRAGIDVLTALCGSADGLGVAELAERTGANKHMVFRCLKTLVAKGWVTESRDRSTRPRWCRSTTPRNRSRAWTW